MSVQQKIKITTVSSKYNSVVVLMVVSVLVAINSQAQQMKADRYKDAHKKYETAVCPVPNDGIKHFVYFARDRESIVNHPLLAHPSFQGAQVMYSWRDLEKAKGVYDFSLIKSDLEYLAGFEKKLFIQLQDASFNPNNKAIPDYLFTGEYDGGAVLQLDEKGQPLGWAAKRWNSNLRVRFALLLLALGKEFDGLIEGINFQETAIGVNRKTETNFTEKGYIAGLKENMLALKKAFPKSVTMIYANFIPGEFLPWDDKGYLRSIYEYGEQIGVGLGGPDLMMTRRAQLNHALAMMHEKTFTVPLGIAVQDGNYTGMTGADTSYNEEKEKGRPRKNIVPQLHAFAKDFLKVSYIFWVNQEPYSRKMCFTAFLNVEA